MKRAFIFDMDGVLIDSQPYHYEVDLYVLRYCGAKCELSDLEKYAGTANKDRWPAFQREFGITGYTVPEMIDLHAKRLLTMFDEDCPPAVKGIPELLVMLKDHNIKTAIASSSSRALINLVVNKLGFSPYFDKYVTGEEVENGKPAPDVFLYAAAQLGVTPAESVVVEDSTNGVKAAYNAGIHCVGYINPTSGKQDLSLASLIIDDFSIINKDLKWLDAMT